MALALPATAAAQETLLEQWTVSYIADGWAPRWSPPDDERLELAHPRVRADVEVDFLSLQGSLSQRVTRLGVRASHPLTGPVSAIVSGVSGSSTSSTHGRTLLESPRSEGGAVGVEMSLEASRLGVLHASALAGWDGDPGAWAHVDAHGRAYALSLSGWTTHARRTRLLLPADSLRDIGGAYRAEGTDVSAELDLGVGPVRMRPRGAWRRELLRIDDAPSGAFLSASPDGRATTTTLGLAVRFDTYGVIGTHRRRDVDVASPLTRSELAAGQIYFARFSSTAWSGEAWTTRLGRRWSASLSRERVLGELAARVETWPFVSLWATLSAQAYRLDGDLSGDALAGWLRSEPSAHGWTWGAHLGRYAVRSHRDSWYVTSFGFGRSDRQITDGGADPAYLVGGEIGRTVAAAGAELHVRARAAVPVHARSFATTSGTGSGAGTGSGGLAGYGGLSVTWTW